MSSSVVSDFCIGNILLPLRSSQQGRERTEAGELVRRAHTTEENVKHKTDKETREQTTLWPSLGSMDQMGNSSPISRAKGI